MTFDYQFRLRRTWLFIMMALLIGCSAKTDTPESAGGPPPLSATITEIDEHGNAVTALGIEAFTARGWHLGDTLEATFANGQTIQIQFVENYGDVPVGDYLCRFSTSSGRLKIAINHGDIAETLQLESASKVTLRKVEPPAN